MLDRASELEDYVPQLLHDFLSLSRSEKKERFASTRAVADICEVNQRTIQGWIAEGKVDAVRIGRKYLVDLDSLRRFLESFDA